MAWYYSEIAKTLQQHSCNQESTGPLLKKSYGFVRAVGPSYEKRALPYLQ